VEHNLLAINAEGFMETDNSLLMSVGTAYNFRTKLYFDSILSFSVIGCESYLLDRAYAV